MLTSYSALVKPYFINALKRIAVFITRRVDLLRQLWTKINMFSGDQRRVGRSKKPAALQSKVAGQIGELFVQDVVISELFLIKRRCL